MSDSHRTTHWHNRLMLLVLIAAACLVSSTAPLPAQDGTKSMDLSTAIIKVARDTIPAVVHIEVTEKKVEENPLLPFENDPFFRHFFNVPQMPRKFKKELKGLGTGMILDDKGHILTNHHVAGGATKIEVQLSNGDQYPAKLIGTDPKTDLAVIKIAARESLPYVKFADSDLVEVGQWVVAIGHPRGLDQTVTQGIISAKHRQGITDPDSYQDFLQTDAAINPGNSGGPLLNLNGEVIGVNAVIVSQSGGFEGIGFTIPSNIATHISKALIAHGKVQRGWLGVEIRDLTPELAKTVQADTVKGALVAAVVKGSPAEEAGIRKNDVIIAFAGKETPDSSRLRNAVADYPVDRQAEIRVWRNGKVENLTVKIGNLASAEKILASSIREKLGIEVRAVTPDEQQQYNLQVDQGVAITNVDPKGPLGEAGFEIDDIILGINDNPVTGVDNFIAVVGALQARQRATLLVIDHRTGSMGKIRITLR